MTTPHTAHGTARKRGRKSADYRTSWGEVINGLARRPKDGRWRVIGSPCQTFTEPDERLAIHKFRTLVSKTEKATIAVPFATAASVKHLSEVVATLVKPTRPSDALDFYDEFIAPPATGSAADDVCRVVSMPDGGYEFHRGKPIDASVFWPWLRRLILEKRELVARQTGIESIAYLQELKPPAPLPSFDEIKQIWKQHAKCSKDQISKVVRAFDDFITTTGIGSISEIDPETVVRYQDNVYGRTVTAKGKEPDKISGKQQMHLFTGIRTILRFVKKRAIAVEAVSKAMDSLSILSPSESTVSIDPHPISKEDWKKLYKAATGEDKALILVMLNCALYVGEAVRLKWDDINKDGCLVANRNKTGKIIRVAVLWKETIQALKACKNETDHIFLNYAGRPIAGGQKRFNDLAAKAGVSDVTGSHLRDGAYTAAVQANVTESLARILVGHRSGMSDMYVARNPEMVKPATDAVYKYYMK